MTCGRCGAGIDVRETVVNRWREAREDGNLDPEAVWPRYAIEARCRDRDACRERAKGRA